MNTFFKEKKCIEIIKKLNFSTTRKERLRFMPELTKDSQVIIPISMTRYDSDDNDKIKKYDQKIAELLSVTAEKLEKKEIKSVDIFSSAGLQTINWGKEKAERIDAHFFKTHEKLLSRQSSYYNWASFIDKIGEKKFEENYQLINSESEPGSLWYSLMLKSQKNIGINGALKSSLEYQRKEYAIILSTDGLYTNISYMGFISPGWAYLYEIHKECNLPIFTQVIFEKLSNNKYIKTTNSESIADTITGSVHEALVSSDVPEKEKERIRESIKSLIYAYQPKIDRKNTDLLIEKSPKNKNPNF